MSKNNDRFRIVTFPDVNSARINEYLSHSEPSVHLLGGMLGSIEAADEMLQDKAHTWRAFDASTRGRERSRPNIWLLSPIDRWRELQGVVRIALGRSVQLENDQSYAGNYIPFIDLRADDPRAHLKGIVPVGAVALVGVTDGDEYVHGLYGLQPEPKSAMSFMEQILARNAGAMPEAHAPVPEAAFPMTQDA